MVKTSKARSHSSSKSRTEKEELNVGSPTEMQEEEMQLLRR